MDSHSRGFRSTFLIDSPKALWNVGGFTVPAIKTTRTGSVWCCARRPRKNSMLRSRTRGWNRSVSAQKRNVAEILVDTESTLTPGNAKEIKNQFCFKQWGSLNMHSITKYFEDLGRFCPERPWTNVKAMKVSLCLERLQLLLASNHPFFLVPYRHTDFELKASKVFREKIETVWGQHLWYIHLHSGHSMGIQCPSMNEPASAKRTYYVFGHFSSRSKFHGSFYCEMTTSFAAPDGSWNLTHRPLPDGQLFTHVGVSMG